MSTLQQTLLKTLLACLLLFGFAVGVSATPTYTVLHDFDCSTEGCSPYYSVLAQGRDGNLYGTATSGGTYGFGTVFKVTPAGTVTTLYNFDGTTGSTPNDGLTLGTDGKFYGTTNKGGTFGLGTIFRITPTGTLTVLHHFGSVAGDGYNPFAPPIQGIDGNFYGMTIFGFAYKISASGVYKLISGATYGTYSPLIQASDGNFYGTSYLGNRVFKMTKAGKVTALYRFDGNHGSEPYGPLVQGTDGDLYGTTMFSGTSSGGVVFKLTLKGAITVLMNFDSSYYQPTAGLVAATDGNFYGATRYGGTSGNSALFKTATTGVTTVENSFDGTHGSQAFATPMQHTNGKIYGLTHAGGVNNSGVIYSLDEGLAPFISMTSAAAKVGVIVGILGQGFTGASAVSFGGTAATTVTVISDTYMTAKVPVGALTGNVTVTTPSGTLTSNRFFRVTPAISGFAPTSGPIGTSVIITGGGLTQTSKVTIGGKVATFIMNSSTQVTATVPATAVTGKVAITTTGGVATSTGIFTVTP